MRSCFALLPALALSLLVFAGGCGQATTSVKPKDVLEKEDYESQLENQAPIDGSQPDPASQETSESEGGDSQSN